MRQFRTEIGLLAAIVVVLLAAFLINREPYLSSPIYNLQRLLHETALLGIFSLGTAVVIISGGIDLSSGSVIAFAGSICTCTMLLLAPVDARGNPDFAALGVGQVAAGIAAATVAGLCIGTVHAWLITSVRLPPFVATLASLVGLRSGAQLLNREIDPA